uniref:Uncharacterized protein n=1 Tax=Chromera velia CCMP2878 TaxID=1169474 RepID=A0A0G4GAR8_9ALVE|eukprot:Cvel_21043.t1-p1 / transcript=Cvel_21043.t1 / gene=Cvel_21043 / organism=Chromera_velia_CCMP2878 / gene_product=hypothetical protein / transcript_product=hypothetical protein / location=Cvel_scaffold1942:26028-35621(-) / protein_length=1241 / sequence_SO=supercontig / SO=protein_coding / is_pseudo=false
MQVLDGRGLCEEARVWKHLRCCLQRLEEGENICPLFIDPFWVEAAIPEEKIAIEFDKPWEVLPRFLKHLCKEKCERRRRFLHAEGWRVVKISLEGWKECEDDTARGRLFRRSLAACDAIPGGPEEAHSGLMRGHSEEGEGENKGGALGGGREYESEAATRKESVQGFPSETASQMDPPIHKRPQSLGTRLSSKEEATGNLQSEATGTNGPVGQGREQSSWDMTGPAFSSALYRPKNNSSSSSGPRNANFTSPTVYAHPPANVNGNVAPPPISVNLPTQPQAQTGGGASDSLTPSSASKKRAFKIRNAPLQLNSQATPQSSVAMMSGAGNVVTFPGSLPSREMQTNQKTTTSVHSNQIPPFPSPQASSEEASPPAADRREAEGLRAFCFAVPPFVPAPIGTRGGGGGSEDRMGLREAEEAAAGSVLFGIPPPPSSSSGPREEREEGGGTLMPSGTGSVLMCSEFEAKMGWDAGSSRPLFPPRAGGSDEGRDEEDEEKDHVGGLNNLLALDETSEAFGGKGGVRNGIGRDGEPLQAGDDSSIPLSPVSHLPIPIRALSPAAGGLLDASGSENWKEFDGEAAVAARRILAGGEVVTDIGADGDGEGAGYDESDDEGERDQFSSLPSLRILLGGTACAGPEARASLPIECFSGERMEEGEEGGEDEDEGDESGLPEYVCGFYNNTDVPAAVIDGRTLEDDLFGSVQCSREIPLGALCFLLSKIVRRNAKGTLERGTLKMVGDRFGVRIFLHVPGWNRPGEGSGTRGGAVTSADLPGYSLLCGNSGYGPALDKGVLESLPVPGLVGSAASSSREQRRERGEVAPPCAFPALFDSEMEREGTDDGDGGGSLRLVRVLVTVRGFSTGSVRRAAAALFDAETAVVPLTKKEVSLLCAEAEGGLEGAQKTLEGLAQSVGTRLTLVNLYAKGASLLPPSSSSTDKEKEGGGGNEANGVDKAKFQQKGRDRGDGKNTATKKKGGSKGKADEKDSSCFVALIEGRRSDLSMCGLLLGNLIDQRRQTAAAREELRAVTSQVAETKAEMAAQQQKHGGGGRERERRGDAQQRGGEGRQGHRDRDAKGNRRQGDREREKAGDRRGDGEVRDGRDGRPNNRRRARQRDERPRPAQTASGDHSHSNYFNEGGEAADGHGGEGQGRGPRRGGRRQGGAPFAFGDRPHQSSHQQQQSHQHWRAREEGGWGRGGRGGRRRGRGGKVERNRDGNAQAPHWSSAWTEKEKPQGEAPVGPAHAE